MVAPPPPSTGEKGTWSNQSRKKTRLGSQERLGAVQPQPSASAAAASTIVNLPSAMLSQFVNNEILTHLPLIQAAVGVHPQDASAALQFPQDWAGLRGILHKLAFDVDAADIWRRLGLAALDGPAPSAAVIGSRVRLGKLICDMALKTGWADDCKRAARAAGDSLQAAAEACTADLDSVLAARRRYNIWKLPLHKELGAKALRLLRRDAIGGAEDVLTQWSNIAALGDVSADSVAITRRLAGLAEKGDPRLWDELAGRRVVLWAPTDSGALGRLLSAFLKRADPQNRPLTLRLSAPIALFPGMATLAQVEALWWHPLLSQKWSTTIV